MYQSKDQFAPIGSHTISSPGISFKVNVGELLKILERIFDCRIKIQFSKNDLQQIASTADENADTIKKDTTIVSTAPAPKQVFTVIYNKSIYKAFWWNWLPGSIFEKMYKNLELLAFKNSVATVEIPDTILSTWGAIEQYYYDLRPILIHAYNFINRICGGTSNTIGETNIISSKLFCFMFSSIVRGKSVLSVDSNLEIGQIPADVPIPTVAQKNLNKADPLIQDIFKDDIISLSPSVWSKLITMESKNQLNADNFVECILAMGNESFNKFHLLIDHQMENSIIGSSANTAAIELERILLRDGKLILDYIRTFILGTSKLSTLTPTTSRPTSKDSSMRTDSSSKNGALRKSMLVGKNRNSINKGRNTMKDPSRSSFMLSMKVKNNRPSQMVQNVSGDKSTPSWATLTPTQETVEEGDENEDEGEDEDNDEDEDDSSSGSESDSNDSNDLDEERNVKINNEYEQNETSYTQQSTVRWDDQLQDVDKMQNREDSGSSNSLHGMEIFIHHAELYFDPELRAVQGIAPCLYDLYFTYLALRRLLYSLYISGSSGDMCIAQLEKNHVAINHYRYQLIRKVFIRWSLVEK